MQQVPGLVLVLQLYGRLRDHFSQSAVMKQQFQETLESFGPCYK